VIRVPLSAIAEVIRGVSFSKDEGRPIRADGTLPIIRAGSIQETLLLTEGQIWVPHKKIHVRQKIRRNDIVICTSSGSSDLVGKCARSDVDFDGSFGAFCAGIRPIESKVSPSYLYHFLSSIEFRNWTRASSGANIKNIRISELSNFEVPLPPLTEQKRIAAILDKAEAIRRKRRQTIKCADEFLRAVFLDMFGDPVTNPKGWDLKLLADIVKPDSIITYGIVQAGPHVEGGIPYIRTGDFKNGVLAKDGYACTSEQIASKFKRSQVTTGDLVYCIRASIGSVDIVPEYLNGANLTQGTAKISPGKNVDPYFLLEQMRTSGFRAWIDQNSKGATFKEITLAKLREAPIYVPPLNDQLKFVEIRSKTIDKIKNSMVRCDLPLFESLSQKAFSGQL